MCGLALESGETFACRAIVITTGTFLNGLVHIGPEQRPSGRAGEPPSQALAESIKSFGFEWGRLKTGTPPRLHRDSIDFSRFVEEKGDADPAPFSFLTDRIDRPQIVCHLLHTTDTVHDLVRSHIAESPLYNGQIAGHRPALLPVARGQSDALSAARASPAVSRTGGTRRRRGLHQRLLDEPAVARAVATGPCAARSRRCGHAASRLRGRVRFRATDRTSEDARSQTRPWALSRRANQRHLGV